MPDAEVSTEVKEERQSNIETENRERESDGEAENISEEVSSENGEDTTVEDREEQSDTSDPEDSQKEDNQNDSNENDGAIDEVTPSTDDLEDKYEELGADEIMKTQYSYRQQYRNPFAAAGLGKSQQSSESETESDILTYEEAKEQIPFVLTGIIDDGADILAVVDYSGSSVIVEEGSVINEYRITNITDREIFINYMNYQFKLGMESGIGEAM